ncbi:MAG: glycosyltransferase, partial [Armatimonadetes bacterium]|nr:glycosyltransferase [Armatimonadota bacterium]
TDREAARIELRARLRLPSDAFLVGGCGTMEWRKGADWWAQLAAQITDERIHFVWLGGQKNAFSRQVEFDLKKLNLEKRVHFLPPTAHTAPFFAALDAFALTSREDPFPLVALEAAAQLVPVLCFDRAGGASELVGENAGFVAPYGDVAAMARALETWRREETLRLSLGETAARKARAMGEVSVGAPRIVALLERTASQFARGAQPPSRRGV